MKKEFDINIKGLFGDMCAIDNKDCIMIGQCFLGDKLLSVQVARDFIRSCIGGDVSNLQKLNGFFTVVMLFRGDIYIVSDKVRSRPIFYSVSSKVLVSDDFYQIIDKSDKSALDNISCEEYLYTGYVTGHHTLVDEVYQVEAAQIVRINSDGEIYRKNYWYFLPEKNVVRVTDRDFWYRELDLALENSINRLVKIADGRQIVIPLSGGYDSRAIALYLKRSGYRNIIAFTFGKPDSHESKMSRRIAGALDIEWHNVHYSERMWRELKRTEEFSEYVDCICSGVSTPNVQVYPAVKKLLFDNVINKDAIVVPGHAADFVAGSHFKKLHLSELRDRSSLYFHIIGKHYIHQRRPVSKGLSSKIKRLAVDGGIELSASYLANAELWNWRERQSKFIVNSNRYYDFFGLSWWMPFWDNEFIEVWEKVPYSLRLGTALWADFVNDAMVDFIGQSAPIGRSDTKRNLYHKVKNKLNYLSDPNGLNALIPFNRWILFNIRVSKNTGTVFGVLSESYIDKLRKRLSEC